MLSLRQCIAPLVGVFAVAATLLSSCAGAQTDSKIAFNGAAFEPAITLPADLTFTRSDGGTFTTADTRGRLSVFFFGYTHCAEVCPLTLALFSQMRRALGPAANSVEMYFVTLDPARDTAERMRTYMANFPGVTGLIGSPDELARLQSAFGFASERENLPGGDYAINHTAATYFVNEQSKIQLVYPDGTPPTDMAADLLRLASALS